jgi:hypothetical protein
VNDIKNLDRNRPIAENHVMNARTTDDPFLLRARARMESLARDEALLAAQEEGVKRRRIEVQQAIADLGRSIDLYQDLMGINEASSPGQIPAVFETVRGPLSTLIFDVLRARDGRGKVSDIVLWLQELGRFPTDPDHAAAQYSSVYTALLRDPRMEKVGRGEFRIDESPLVEPDSLTA